MVAARNTDVFRRNAEAAPDIGDELALAQELGPLVGADPGGDDQAGLRPHERRALGNGFRFIEPQGLVQPGLEQRPEIEEPADRGDALEAPALGRRKRPRDAGHPRDEMAAGRMSAEHDRAGDAGPDEGDGARDLRRNVGDTDRRRERVARNGDAPATTQGAGAEVGPEGLVEVHPVAAVDEHGEALRLALGEKEIEPLPLAAAVGEVKLGAPAGPPVGGEFRRARRPQRRKDVGLGDMRRVGSRRHPSRRSIGLLRSRERFPAKRAYRHSAVGGSPFDGAPRQASECRYRG